MQTFLHYSYNWGAPLRRLRSCNQLLTNLKTFSAYCPSSLCILVFASSSASTCFLCWCSPLPPFIALHILFYSPSLFSSCHLSLVLLHTTHILSSLSSLTHLPCSLPSRLPPHACLVSRSSSVRMGRERDAIDYNHYSSSATYSSSSLSSSRWVAGCHTAVSSWLLLVVWWSRFALCSVAKCVLWVIRVCSWR